MITIQDETARFAALLKRLPNDIKTTGEGIPVPFANLTAVMGELLRGATYCFFGNKQENALEAWYINWLGKLAARDLVCVINERMQQAGGDFYHLLCLQAHLDRCELKRGLFPAREQKRILSIINDMDRYKICWRAPQDYYIPPATSVELSWLTFSQWQARTVQLKHAAEKTNRVQLLFVSVTREQMDSTQSDFFYEELGHCVGWVSFLPQTADCEKPILQVKLRPMNCLREKDVFFSYNYKTQELTPVDGVF